MKHQDKNCANYACTLHKIHARDKLFLEVFTPKFTEKGENSDGEGVKIAIL